MKTLSCKTAPMTRAVLFSERLNIVLLKHSTMLSQPPFDRGQELQRFGKSTETQLFLAAGNGALEECLKETAKLCGGV